MKLVAPSLLTLVVATCLVFVELTGQPVASQQTVSDDSTELGSTLDRRLTDAYHRRDWVTLQSLVAPDYAGITEDFEWDFASLQREFHKIRLVDSKIERQRIKRLAPDLILVNDIFTMHETFDGEDISGRYNSSDVWVRRNGHWLLLIEQEVRLRGSGQ